MKMYCIFVWEEGQLKKGAWELYRLKIQLLNRENNYCVHVVIIFAKETCSHDT